MSKQLFLLTKLCFKLYLRIRINSQHTFEIATELNGSTIIIIGCFGWFQYVDVFRFRCDLVFDQPDIFSKSTFTNVFKMLLYQLL